MEAIRKKSPAKINLALRVHERMPNGYHRIETVMVKLALADEVEIQIEEGDDISVSVPGFPELENEQNLAWRAANEFLRCAQLKRKVSIRLQKKIPMGGGLGGGSSNAGTVLLALMKELGQVGPERLHEIASRLGADVPFFIYGRSFGYAAGIGEELKLWKPLSSRPVILVFPGFPSATAEAYRALSRPLTYTHPGGTSFAPQNGPKNWNEVERLFLVGNDLQAPVEQRFPKIGEVRKTLSESGCPFVQMSGSGSTVFGLFESHEQVDPVLSKLPNSWRIERTETLST